MAASKKAREKMFAIKGTWCNGCGRRDVHISCSHRIPEKRRRDLKDNLDNIDPMGIECGCHDKVERGRYSELANGPEILEYIRINDPELYELKIAKIERRGSLSNNNTVYVTF